MFVTATEPRLNQASTEVISHKQNTYLLSVCWTLTSFSFCCRWDSPWNQKHIPLFYHVEYCEWKWLKWFHLWKPLDFSVEKDGAGRKKWVLETMTSQVHLSKHEPNHELHLHSPQEGPRLEWGKQRIHSEISWRLFLLKGNKSKRTPDGVEWLWVRNLLLG